MASGGSGDVRESTAETPNGSLKQANTIRSSAIQTHRKLDNEALNVYHCVVSDAGLPTEGV
jgi:hypothetical protein